MADEPHANQGQGLPPQNSPKPETVKTADRSEFPYPADQPRLVNYQFYDHLFLGHHYEAFSTKISSASYGQTYGKLRYIVANFPGLISRIVADLLFIEPPKIEVQDGDQEFMNALIKQNGLRIMSYESALTSSSLGDTLFKLRIGKRRLGDDASSIIIDEVTPKIYFPILDPFNVKGDPLSQELAWTVMVGDKKYLRKEIHTVGMIRNELWEMENTKIKTQVPLSTLGQGIRDVEMTGIKSTTLTHIPNWRYGNEHFGRSDYLDLETLFYALNNRMTKTDNILDKHSDPILALPDTVLDEDGNVRASKKGLFIRGEGGTKEMDPAYIVWDANLESGFKEVEKLIELTFMMSETSPDILGMGQGQSDSGRALKMKLLRTIAKAQRKQLYYTQGLQRVLYTAQELAQAYGIEIDGKRMQGEPVMPEIIWSDGLPTDLTELIEQEAARLDAGLTTKAESIMRLEDIDQEAAEKKAKAIKDEEALAIPMSNVAGGTNGFGKPNQTPPNGPVKPAGQGPAN